jgi:lipoprotein-anchoring transpeptidase ErfK/SrfK
MQFKSGGYAIHGTNVDSSIGNNVSHGCVRMHNSDVIELYSLVPYGTTVIVKNTSQSDKQIAAQYGIAIN